jgi:hypothetical protein
MTLRLLARSCLGAWAAEPLALAAAIFLFGCGGQSYSCGDASGGHCYGTVSWSGSPTGLFMNLTAVPLTSGDIFIDDEAWLIDYTSAGATWVEAGEENVNISYYGGEGGTYYFWAYGVDNEEIMGYPLGPISQSDLDHATWNAYRINQDASSPSTWDVKIWEPASGTTLYSESVSNPMTPTTVIEGQELAGSSDAQAPLAFFNDNSVFQGSKESYQTTNGLVCKGVSPSCPGAPPNAGWWFNSEPPQIGNGGIFFTDCC